ncbi:family 43 glycosylhydrolase, partial [Mariniphaga sediminis]|uniref:family 43 glycosylhydrolase n=1 Tax=Mariniphaga sediminis TaxID=1628158 RepID=UPI0035615106
ALVTNDMTTEYTNISWDDIDPTVWIDDDGQAYLFWGNTQCYYAKLKGNMIELDGAIQPVDVPDFTEAPWIHKKDDWYYLSYASGFPEKTVYTMSKSIHGPWEYKGILNEIAGNSNTNHQSIVNYKGKWYFVYHNGGIQTEGGSFHRSVCIDYLNYNEDGTLKRVRMTSEGVDEVEK